MVVSANTLRDRAKILEDPEAQINPDVLLNKLREFDQSLKRRNVSFIRVWRINVIVAVATALVAVGILLASFICGLLGAT